jgi:hypothetical protein
MGPVNISFPQSEFREAYTKTYASKSDAIGDLYQSHENYSDHCLFDRATRTIFPQARDRDPESHLPTNGQGLELLWLPMQSFPNSRCIEGGDKSFETFGNFGFGRISPSEEFRADHLDRIHTSSHIWDQNMSFWDSDGECDDLEDTVPLEYSSSTVDRDSNRLCYPYIKITVREVSNSISRDPTYENDQAKSAEMNDPYRIRVDNETAGEYIGSIFSSSIDSTMTDRKSKQPDSDSAECVWSKIEDSRPEEAERVKTWAELGKDFLDVYAPFDQIGTEQRAKVAVHNALSTRGGLLDDFVYESGAASSYNSSKIHNSSKMDQQIWSRDKGSDDGVTFHHVEDIVKYESAKEPSSQAAKMPFAIDCKDPTQGRGPKEVVHKQESDKSSERDTDVKGKSKEKSELAMSFLSAWAESDIFRENWYLKKEQEPTPDARLIETEFTNNTRISHYVPNFADSHQIETNQSNANSKTGRASSFRNSFVLLQDQPKTAEGKTSKETVGQFDTAKFVAGHSEPLPRTPHEVMKYPMTENRTGGKAAHQKQRVPTPTYPEAEEASSLPPAQRLLADLNWVNSFAASTSILNSDAGKIQAPRPHIRTVLAPIVPSSHNPETTYPAAYISDAETEVSEDFGEKLRRYGRTREDEKDNEEQWWRDFVLYG